MGAVADKKCLYILYDVLYIEKFITDVLYTKKTSHSNYGRLPRYTHWTTTYRNECAEIRREKCTFKYWTVHKSKVYNLQINRKIGEDPFFYKESKKTLSPD